jgi:hypothetical protein
VSAAFEFYEDANGRFRAAAPGFNWFAFLGSGVWAAASRLWLPAVVLLTAEVSLLYLVFAVFATLPAAIGISILLIHFAAGWAGNRWRCERWQRSGFLFRGYVVAKRAGEAIRNVKVTRTVLRLHAPPGRLALVDQMPQSSRGVLAVAGLTIKSAFRIRAVPFLFVAVFILIVGMPLMLKHDGTATGFMQIVVTYTLGSVMTILVMSTLWMAIGSLAREVEGGQIQMVTSKPITRWQILGGKWLGIMGVNLLLLAFVGMGIQFFIEWRGQQLPERERIVLERDLLVARGVIGEELPDFQAIENDRYSRFIADNPALEHEQDAVRDEFRKQIIAEFESVAPGYVRQWVIPAGPAADALKQGEATLRVEFQAGYNRRPKALSTAWEVGPRDGKAQRLVTTLTTDTPHYLPLKNPELDADGNLIVQFHNYTDESFVFATGEGLQLLYRESGFASNLVRAFAILFCWLGLAAAVGLTAASKLNFNVAAFFAIGLIGSGMFSGTIQNVVEQGSVWSYYEGELNLLQKIVGMFMYVLIRLLHLFMGVVRDYSPIEALGTGRTIAWAQLATAFAHCWLLFGSLLGALGIYAFTRRELADPFNN